MSIHDGQMGSYIDLQGKRYRDKLHIYDGKWNHTRGQDIGSNKWIKNKKNQLDVRKRLRNVFNYWQNNGVTSETFLYTTHKEYQKTVHPDKVSGLSNRLNDDYGDSDKRESMEDKDRRNVSFLSQTIRGTNDFNHKKFMALTCNTFLDPQLDRFLKYHDVSIDEESYALNRMIQWLWRGCIRKEQEMHVFVPSRRMRHLLLRWLGYSE